MPGRPPSSVKRMLIQNCAPRPTFRKAATGGHEVRLWDVRTGRLLRSLRGPSDYVRSVSWSPDGKTLAAVLPGKKVWLWEAESGQALPPLEGEEAWPNVVAWSPEMNIHDTSRLVVWFKDVPVPMLPEDAAAKEGERIETRKSIASGTPEKPAAQVTENKTPAPPAPLPGAEAPAPAGKAPKNC